MIAALPLTLTVNGEEGEYRVGPLTTLAEFLRGDLGLTGTHLACEEGVCGSCTVLMDGKTVRSCLTLALQADGRKIVTAEGYADDARLKRVQDGFAEGFAAQCGFCTSGMMAVVAEYLDDQAIEVPESEATIRQRLCSAACRCTGYQFITETVVRLARSRKEAASRG